MSEALTLLLAAAMVGSGAAAVLMPLLRRGPGRAPAAGAASRRPGHVPPEAAGAPGAPRGARLAEARAAKRAALEEMLALEAEGVAGGLAEADYVELRRQAEERALALIAEVDALEAALGPDAPPEDAEVATGARAGVGPAAAPARRADGQAGGRGGSREPSGQARRRARPDGGAPGAAAAGRRWARGTGLAAASGALLVLGVGLGYVLAGRDGRVSAGGAGEPATAAAMPGPVMAQVREYRARLEKDPRDLEALLGMGMLNVQRQDVGQAFDYYKRALEVDPGNADGLTGLGLLLGQAGHYQEALQAFDKALARDPNHLEALWMKGEVQLRGLRDYPAAAETWQRVAALLPEGPDRARAVAALTEARSGIPGDAAAPAEGAPPPPR